MSDHWFERSTDGRCPLCDVQTVEERYAEHEAPLYRCPTCRRTWIVIGILCYEPDANPCEVRS